MQKKQKQKKQCSWDENILDLGGTESKVGRSKGKFQGVQFREADRVK